MTKAEQELFIVEAACRERAARQVLTLSLLRSDLPAEEAVVTAWRLLDRAATFRRLSGEKAA